MYNSNGFTNQQCMIFLITNKTSQGGYNVQCVVHACVSNFIIGAKAWLERVLLKHTHHSIQHGSSHSKKNGIIRFIGAQYVEHYISIDQ